MNPVPTQPAWQQQRPPQQPEPPTTIPPHFPLYNRNNSHPQLAAANSAAAQEPQVPAIIQAANSGFIPDVQCCPDYPQRTPEDTGNTIHDKEQWYEQAMRACKAGKPQVIPQRLYSFDAYARCDSGEEHEHITENERLAQIHGTNGCNNYHTSTLQIANTATNDNRHYTDPQ